MPTTVTMFKTQDGVLCATLKEALAHERSTYLTLGVTPLFERLTSVSDRLNAESMVRALLNDELLLGDFRKFFSKIPPDQPGPVAKKRARRSAKKVTEPGVDSEPVVTPTALDAQGTPAEFLPPAADPTDDELDALSAMAGDPIIISEEGAPPPPP